MRHIRRHAPLWRIYSRALALFLFLACSHQISATCAEPFFNKAADTFVADDFCLEVWRMKRMPLKVFIHECADIPGYDPRFKQSFIDACSELSGVTENKISFTPTDREDTADVDVRWVPTRAEFPSAKWPDAIGICRRSVDATDGSVDHASIYLLSKPPDGIGKAYGQNYMKLTCLHELGHACGLGHSLRGDDVMYKKHCPAELTPDGVLETKVAARFSARDAASLNLLITAQNKIIDVKESCDAKTACSKFNNEAIRLIKAGDNGQALIYLRAALERDESDRLAMGNAMIALFNCACDLNNRSHWAEALPILEKSMQLAKKVGAPGELNQMVSVKRNCMTQLAQRKL
jgi:hypothetical protein